MTSPPQDDFIFDPNNPDGIPELQEEQAQAEPEPRHPFIDMDNYGDTKESREASLGKYFKDVLIQGAKGVAKRFTWPMDVLKMAMLGEALSDLDELEEAYRKAGKEFDRDQYTRNVLQQAEFVPTQEFFENVIEDNTGFSLEPETPAGERIKQAFNIAAWLKGSGAGKMAAGAVIGPAVSEVAERAGAGPVFSEILGDVSGLGVPFISKIPRVLSQEASELAGTAQKFNLPFWEGVAQPKPSGAKVLIRDRSVKLLENELGVGVEEAFDQVASGKIPLAKLRQDGINIEGLSDEAISRVAELASSSESQVSVDPIIQTIRAKRAEIAARAPNPSKADKAVLDEMAIIERDLLQAPNVAEAKAALKKLESTPDILVNDQAVVNFDGTIMPKSEAKSILEERIAAPPVPKDISAEQAINQFRNWNRNLKQIYKNPEFSGREDAIRFMYEDLKNSATLSIEAAGDEELASAFRQSNRIYSQAQDLQRVEGILARSMEDGVFNAKKLDSILNSRDGKVLNRILGEDGVADLQAISKLGRKAKENVLSFGDKGKGLVERLGPLAPIWFIPTGAEGALLKTSVALGPYVQGWMMSRPASRTVYRSIMEAAAKGNMDALPAHFDTLYDLIDEEFGSFDNFVQAGFDELDIFKASDDDRS